MSATARGGRQRRNFKEDPDVKLSKSLSWLLRHGAEKNGFTLDKGGFLYVDEILALQQFKNYSVDDVKRVVDNNTKKRFSLRDHPENSKLQICANQGHTLEVDGLDLKPITDASQYPTVIHGTYLNKWELIKKQGLSRMKRNHIHFAPGEPGEDGVISGMRGNCQVIIYLDLDKALQDGIKFFISANNVILSAGNEEGLIPAKYFTDAIKLRPREKLSINET
ncbi:tRNA 2'-phosphotransferase 1-like [Glandiceps talaboti]